MPEGLEAEIWRRALDTLIGRTVTCVWVDDRVAPASLPDLVAGCSVLGVRRHGKVVVIDTDGPSVGLRFGMTGRVIVDGASPIERLEYASGRDDPAWDRLRMHTSPAAGSGAPALRMNDPRRLGSIVLDPDLTALGVDLLAVDRRSLRSAFAGRRAAVKTALLNQEVVAGLGNLCADEVLWWAAVAPDRTIDSLRAEEIGALAGAMRRRLPIMLRRGGSTTGTLTPEVRRAESPCPRDGCPLRRTVIGGRTAVWCPAHQI